MPSGCLWRRPVGRLRRVDRVAPQVEAPERVEVGARCAVVAVVAVVADRGEALGVGLAECRSSRRPG